MKKQGVILAAGRGSRLSEVSNGRPKCLVEVGGTTLIERQLETLERLGIHSVCVIVGHRADEVRSVLQSRCDFIVNPRYFETNSLYSLWLARSWVDGPFILMNSDIVAHPDIYHRVLAVNGPALAYDSDSGHEPEHMKVSVSGRLVRAIGKTLPSDEVDGENVGILQFDRVAARRLFDEAETLIVEGGEHHWAPAATDRLARRMPVQAVDIRGLPWTEIDFPDDLHTARTSTGPLIESGGSTPGREPSLSVGAHARLR